MESLSSAADLQTPEFELLTAELARKCVKAWRARIIFAPSPPQPRSRSVLAPFCPWPRGPS
eukprot:8365783-Pyramimonas_sp.AAC.1